MKTEELIEIYGLYEPDTDELRYIGKARNSQKRLKSHILDSRRDTRPVCLWIAGLVAQGKAPIVKVLERTPKAVWQEAEKRLIAQYRKTSKLLNLAAGGDMPTMTREQRVEGAKRMNAKISKDPAWKRFVLAKRDMAKLYARFNKTPDIHAYTLRLIMKASAADRPDLYGNWATL